MGEVAETLLALMRSPNENTRLQAVREILDRTLGRSSIAIDATHTKIDIGQLYLRACEPRRSPAERRKRERLAALGAPGRAGEGAVRGRMGDLDNRYSTGCSGSS